MINRLSDPRLLDLLFPFHLILDEQLGYVQTGPSLKKVCDSLQVFEEDFALVRPGLGIEYSFESISSYCDQVFILKMKKSVAGMLLKGQFVLLTEEKRLLFVGSPWITSEAVFEQTGLKIRDFALHDSLVDLLQRVKVQQMAVEDVNEMNHVLVNKNEELVSLNREMREAREDVENKNSELRKINTELDKFVYSISHDLRSPLLSIKGILQLIPLKEQLSAATVKYLKMAEKSVNRLDQTIQEILDYSRNARLDLKLSTFSLVQMIEGIFADLRYANEYPVSFSLEVSGGTNIQSDKYRMDTLLKNIIGNAVKYRNPDVQEHWVKVTVTSRNNLHIVSVSDNGMGISEKSLPKIFDMFYRGSSSVTGTGLGLYICKEIIGRLEGTIDVESIPGKGSTFILTVPSAYQQ
ncbi:MAG: ATP-binding protein [Bacteroidota bacterium]